MKSPMRRRVAREAARLLYSHRVGEYKPAKDEAARRLGVTALPSNFEVAVELDHLADEVEGSARATLRVELRREALAVMRHLQVFHPRLIGSVWRGTARQGSDIDLEVFCHDPERVIHAIAAAYPLTRLEHAAKTAAGDTERYLHVHFALPSGHAVEVVQRGLEDLRARRTCEIYGDAIVGLTLPQLRRLLDEDPSKRFLPKER